MKTFLKIFFSLLLLLVITVSVAGCAGYENIGDILADTEQYEGEEVSIKGYVGETLWVSLLSKGAYEVGDDSGTIWVTTSMPPPEKGAEVAVEGIVSPAMKLGDNNLGTVISETERK